MAASFFSIGNFIKWATIPSSVILLLLGFIQRRTRPNRCGHYYPGLVVPMRFLDGYENRWSYALCFGAITSILITLFMQSVFRSSSTDNVQPENTNANDTEVSCVSEGQYIADVCGQSLWVRSILFEVQILATTLVCAPHFACITTAHKLVGALLGFAYSVYWMVFYIVNATRTESFELGEEIGSLMIVRDVPITACFAGLCIRSLWTVFKCYKTKSIRIQVVDNVVESHQIDHVVNLFHKPPDKSPPPDAFVGKIKVKLKDKLLPGSPHFKLPTRIICMTFVQVILVFYIGITMLQVWILLHLSLKSKMPAVLGVISTDFLETILGIFDGVFLTAIAAGMLCSAVYIALFVISYRKNMINFYKGIIPIYLNELPSTAQIVAKSLRLPGYQIAYILWGFWIIFQVVLLIAGIICLGVYLLSQIDYLEKALLALAELLSIPLGTFVIFYVQVFLVKMFLLQPKLNKKDQSPPLNINNRHLYELVSYVFVFFNLAVGLASALLRTIKSFVFGALLLGRLDRCLLMEGLESFDTGYMAYVGTLLVDNAHNHPAMRVFCAVLLRLTCQDSHKAERGILLLTEPQETGSNSRAARRWHLAYTLLNNPDLVLRRKQELASTESIEGDDSVDENRNKVKAARALKRAKWQRLFNSRVDHSEENIIKGDNSAHPEVRLENEVTVVDSERSITGGNSAHPEVRLENEVTVVDSERSITGGNSAHPEVRLENEVTVVDSESSIKGGRCVHPEVKMEKELTKTDCDTSIKEGKSVLPEVKVKNGANVAVDRKCVKNEHRFKSMEGVENEMYYKTELAESTDL